VKATSSKTAREVEELVHLHQGSVRGFLVYLGCPADRLDDLVQDVFLSFLSARFEDRGESSTRAFLRRIARNLFLKTMQRERRQTLLPDLVLAEGAWVEFEREDGGASSLSALRECLAGITGRAAEVLRLRYEESVRLAVVANRLGLTESGVKSILVRTKRKLRDCIKRRLAS
jgi:RNA polymerase sigma-70 factor (ECF subfamily)